MDICVEKTKKFGVWSPPSLLHDDSSFTEVDTAENFFSSLETISYDAARNASITERRVKQLTKDGTLTYGEVPLESLKLILARVNSGDLHEDANPLDESNSIFVDLGSGAARPVVAAACLFPFKTCVGIEILESLHKQALISLDEYLSNLQSRQGLRISGGTVLSELTHRPTADIQLYQGSIFDVQNVYDWTKADFILSNSTCFSKDMIDKLAILGKTLKKGAYFVTFSECLNDHDFEMLAIDRYEMSWGEADVYYHRKL